MFKCPAIRLLAALMAAAVVLVAGCSSGAKPSEPAPVAAPDSAPAAGDQAAPPAEPVTLTFWHTYNTESAEGQAFETQVLPLFREKYPHININAVYFNQNGLHDRLVTALAGGNGPDVMRMDIIWVPEFASLDILEPLDQMPGFEALKANMEAGPLATNLYKGRYYGLPLDTNTQVMIYNPDFLREAGLSAPPKTAEEFKAYAMHFTGQDGKYALSLGGTYPWQILPFWWSLGGRITNDDYTQASGHVNSAESVKALQFIADLNRSGAMAPSMFGDQPNEWDGYRAGSYGSVLQGPWYFSGQEAAVGKDKLVGELVPSGPAGSISVVGGEDVVIFKTSDQKAAAWEFIQFLLSDEVQTAMLPTGQVPVTKSVLNSDAMKQVWYFPIYAEQLKSAWPRTPVPAWNQVDAALGQAFEAVLRGAATPREALDQAATAIDALLQQ